MSQLLFRKLGSTVVSILVVLSGFSQNEEGCVTLSGRTIDEEGHFLRQTEVLFTDIEDKEVRKVWVNDSAQYSVCLPYGFYKLTATKAGYNPGYATVNFSKKTLVPARKNITLTVGELRLLGRVRDWQTYDAMKGVKVTLTNRETGITEELVTEANGDFVKKLSNKLGDSITYDLVILKEGYKEKRITYTNTLDQYGQHIINYAEDLFMYLDGLPENPPLATLTEGETETIMINPIYFNSDSYLLRGDAKRELDKVVALMNKYPSMEIEVGSHTDCRENRWYNEWLSYKRAKSSRLYIKARLHKNLERITGKGYGEYRLLNGCKCEGKVQSYCSEAQHQENRRTEFRIVNMGSASNVKIINNSPNSFDKKDQL